MQADDGHGLLNHYAELPQFRGVSVTKTLTARPDRESAEVERRSPEG
jgi:hypothetical protein